LGENRLLTESHVEFCDITKMAFLQQVESLTL
jgi:hypothetical protein